MHYTLPELDHLRVPTKIVRTNDRVARCRAVEDVLRAQVTKSGEMVDGRTLSLAWEGQYGTLADRETARWRRTLEPAIEFGKVRAMQSRGVWYYAPADQLHLQPPRFRSDLARVEEALRRAVVRLRSAVLLEEIEREIAEDSDLSLQSRLGAAEHVAALLQTKKIQQVKHIKRASGGRSYYSMLDGPQHVRGTAEHHLDRRLRAVQMLWKASRAAPFTTRAARIFAQARTSLRFPDDPPFGWTNALHYLEEVGELIRLTGNDTRWVRWAPAEEWSALPPPEQLERRTRAFQAAETHGWDPSEGEDKEVDPYFVSRNETLRHLVARTKEIAAEQETDARHRGIVARRPVTLEQVRKAFQREGVTQTGSSSLRRSLQEATRVRPGMRTGAVAIAGRVRNRSFFDIVQSPRAKAFVAYQRALAIARGPRRTLRFRVQLLEEAWERSAARLVPVAEPILAERSRSLAAEIHRLLSGLRGASAEADLLPEEQSDATEIISDLKAMRDRCLRLMTHRPAPATLVAFTWTADWLMDIARAHQELIRHRLVPDVSPRTLVTRLPLVDVCHEDEVACLQPLRSSSGTRPVETWLDRVAFACYAAARWGGPYTALTAQQAWHTLGDMRKTAPIISTLLSSEEVRSHAAAAAALAFIDIAEARQTLQTYLERALVREQHQEPVIGAAIETAAFGLGPRPFGRHAVALTDSEATTLERASRQAQTERVRWLAGWSLDAWVDPDGARVHLL